MGEREGWLFCKKRHFPNPPGPLDAWEVQDFFPKMISLSGKISRARMWECPARTHVSVHVGPASVHALTHMQNAWVGVDVHTWALGVGGCGRSAYVGQISRCKGSQLQIEVSEDDEDGCPWAFIFPSEVPSIKLESLIGGWRSMRA